MNFFIVQVRKLRLIDDKSLGESQSLWWSRDQTQEAAWLQSFIRPSPTPPASASCLHLLSLVQSPPPIPHPSPCWEAASRLPGGTLPLGSSSARILRSGPGSALPATPARKEGVGKS